MESTWSQEEFCEADLRDHRLQKRLMMIATRCAEKPESSLNQSCDGWAKTKAAYRFFQNDAVTYRQITRSHCEATKQRCQHYPTVLAIQDTTYFTYSSHPATQGLCPLSRNRGRHKDAIYTTGLIMHSTLAVSTEGLPLGIVDQKIYSRPQPSEAMKKIKQRSHTIALSVEQKDSYRWIESLHITHDHFKHHPMHVVTVCDREADMYDFFNRAHKLGESIVVRANYDRVVNKRTMFSEITGEALWQLLQRMDTATELTVSIPR